ncbi:TRAP transporter small permease subunit [Chloroflexota bacterium]
MHDEHIIIRIIDRINKEWGIYVGYIVLIIMAVTVYEVFLRYVLNNPTVWAHETASMLLGAYCILGGGYTFARGVFPRHIKMDVIFTRYSPRKKAIVEMLALLTFFIYVGVLFWLTTKGMMRSIAIDEHTMSTWRPPIWPLKICLPIGTAMFLIMGVVKFIRYLRQAITGVPLEEYIDAKKGAVS